MRIAISFVTILSACVFTIGCEEAPTKPAAAPAPATGGTASAPVPSADVPVPTDIKMPPDTKTQPAGATTAAGRMPMAAPEGFTPVKLDGNTAKLTSENTTIMVIGKHAPPRGGPNDPNARKIVFEKFTGQIELDPATKTLKSAKAEIDANSLATFNPGLTSHLKNQDFIDVEKFPTIKFESTRITPGAEPGKVEIVGILSLHGETKEVTIPAMMTVSEAGITLDAKTEFDRNHFKVGTGRGAGTMPEIGLSLAVGKKTEVPAER